MKNKNILFYIEKIMKNINIQLEEEDYKIYFSVSTIKNYLKHIKIQGKSKNILFT